MRNENCIKRKQFIQVSTYLCILHWYKMCFDANNYVTMIFDVFEKGWLGNAGSYEHGWFQTHQSAVALVGREQGDYKTIQTEDKKKENQRLMAENGAWLCVSEGLLTCVDTAQNCTVKLKGNMSFGKDIQVSRAVGVNGKPSFCVALW